MAIAYSHMPQVLRPAMTAAQYFAAQPVPVRPVAVAPPVVTVSLPRVAQPVAPAAAPARATVVAPVVPIPAGSWQERVAGLVVPVIPPLPFAAPTATPTAQRVAPSPSKPSGSCGTSRCGSYAMDTAPTPPAAQPALPQTFGGSYAPDAVSDRPAASVAHYSPSAVLLDASGAPGASAGKFGPLTKDQWQTLALILGAIAAAIAIWKAVGPKVTAALPSVSA